jgi:hypothetical protein
MEIERGALQGMGRAGDLVKDAADKTIEALAGYRGGGVEHLSEDLVEYVRNQPMTALLLATGVGIFVGMVLVLARKAERRHHGVLKNESRAQPLTDRLA